MATQVTTSNGRRQMLRRVQFARGTFGDRCWVGALEGEGFRDEVERGPDPHGRMADKADQQPGADLRLRPGSDEGDDERQLERDVRRYPETPAGKAAAGRVDEVGTVGPGAIDHSGLVKAAAEADERQRGRQGGGCASTVGS